MEVKFHTFLTVSVDGGELSASSSGRLISQENIPQDALDRSLVGLQSRSGRGGEEKISYCPCRELEHCHPQSD
jgi:hypothetical protein